MQAYKDAQIELIAGLEVALKNVQAQRSATLGQNIWGSNGTCGIELAFSVIEASLESRIKLAKAYE